MPNWGLPAPLRGAAQEGPPRPAGPGRMHAALAGPLLAALLATARARPQPPDGGQCRPPGSVSERLPGHSPACLGIPVPWDDGLGPASAPTLAHPLHLHPPGAASGALPSLLPAPAPAPSQEREGALPLRFLLHTLPLWGSPLDLWCCLDASSLSAPFCLSFLIFFLSLPFWSLCPLLTVFFYHSLPFS